MSALRTPSIESAFGAALVMRRIGAEPSPVRVAGRFELRRKIGSGGQGSVYEAHDPTIGRDVAVKVLPLVDTDQATREGQALGRLSHPNVVRIYEHGAEADYSYHVLELLRGPSLRKWCVGRSTPDILTKYIEAARGLAAAHAAGLVHRDFKPDNVRIGEQGQAVVVDFGLARHASTLSDDDGDIMLGTLAYAAPERLLGHPATARSDQFSFCVSLWEALYGVNPFGRCSTSITAPERLTAMQGPKLRRRRRVGKNLEAAITRGLSLSPVDRWPTMGDLIDAIHLPSRSRARSAAAGLVMAAALLAGATQAEPAGAAEALARADQVRAEAEASMHAAAEGDGLSAIQSLERAQRRDELRASEARFLSVTSARVADELDSFGDDQEAGLALAVAVILARRSGDDDLTSDIEMRFDARRRATDPRLRNR